MASKLVFAAAVAAASASICIDSLNVTCLDWTSTGGNITFTATCSPPNASLPVSWCAFGVTTNTSHCMFPANIAMIQVEHDSAAGSAWIEDRNNIAFAPPHCYTSQVSYLSAYTLHENGTVQATWTRPRTLPAGLIAQGYQNIAGNMSLISGISQLYPAVPPGVCNPSMRPHAVTGFGVSVNFDADSE